MEAGSPTSVVTFPLTRDLCEALRERFEGKPPKQVYWPKGIHPRAFAGDRQCAGIKAVGADGLAINRRSVRKTHNAWLVKAGVDLEMRNLLGRKVGGKAEALAIYAYTGFSADSPGGSYTVILRQPASLVR